jgi:cbb3-type cytochrome oxidase subunit 3
VNRIPTMLMGADGPEHLAGRRVAKSVECLKCHYDLNGANAVGRCPECGLPVPFSLAGSIDPIVHKLSPIPNPIAVGRGLFLATVVLALYATATFMWVCFTVAMAFRRDNVLDSLKTFRIDRFQGVWWVLALAMLVCGVLAIWSFKPQQRGRVPIGTTRSLVLFTSGLLLLTLGGALIPLTGGRSILGLWLLAASPAMTLPGLGLMLVGFRGILIEVGQRCLTFRRAKVRRQRIPPLLAALGLFGVAWTGFLVGIQTQSEAFIAIAMAVGLLALVFVLVGCWYLLLNAWWIRGALRAPPERLRMLLTAAEPSSHAANVAGE